MAEVIGIAAGVLELTKFALKASNALCREIKGFKYRNDRVNDLLDELESQSTALASLEQLTALPSELDFSTIKLPLRKCYASCKDFKEELSKCLARSGDDKVSFRAWARVRYMGEDIDGYRRRIAGYKYSIDIVLADINLRATSVTIERITACTDLVRDAQAVFEDRLGTIDDKIEKLLQDSAGQHNRGRAELNMIQEDRLSTEKCLELCTHLANHISEVQRSSGLAAAGDDASESPPHILNEGLQECKAALAQATARLSGCEKELYQRFISKSMSTIVTPEDRADLLRLKEEWEATRQSMEACARLSKHIKDDASTVENYATGDAWQYMVSTGEKTIHGKNKGLGWRTRQIGGHMSDESLQEITKLLSSARLDAVQPTDGASDAASNATSDSNEHHGFTSFRGQGHRLEIRQQNSRTSTL